MSMEVVTYANVSRGMLEELVNNEFDVPVKVLGWGTKWRGYSDKTRGVLEYMKTKDDDDIIVFVDGFDTKILRDMSGLHEAFRSYDCRVLLSKDPELSGGLLTRVIFGTCKKNGTANAGMYMGYVKELREMLTEEVNMRCQDDQRNFNALCDRYNFIKVDEHERVFKNVSPYTAHVKTDAYFKSFPGTVSLDRYVRAIHEYTQFVYIHVACILIACMILFPRYEKIFVYLLIALIAIFAFLSDKSCTIN